jgi:light-regulated signal transduction histidine kinase (bacteriophytochrome)
MSNFACFLFEDYVERLDDQAKEYLTQISKSSKKMSRLIEDLLDLSSLSRKELSRAEVDLSSLAASIVSGLRKAEPGRSVEIFIKDGLTASADQSLTEIVLSNLIDNAWKFTSKTAKAQIEFGTIEKDRRVVYYVRDNGAGFDPQFALKMFQPFHRLHSGDEYEGTGIGLSIVERIIRRHRGKVWAEGEVGKGATVYFTLG